MYTEGLTVFAPKGGLAGRLNNTARKINAAPPVLFEAVRQTQSGSSRTPTLGSTAFAR